MNTLILSPSDVLFFRDGRPMGGSLSGHGEAWPLPNVINAALHAACHRSDLQGHTHRAVNRGEVSESRERRFGSLVSAGPFPVKDHQWWFPRPADAQREGDTAPTLLPGPDLPGSSSLKGRLEYAVSNTMGASKDNDPEAWMNGPAWEAYLTGEPVADVDFADDDAFSDTEHTYGIELDPETGTVVEGQFYSASYLRLKADASLGVMAKTEEKRSDGTVVDLIDELFRTDGGSSHIVVGGQQRVCTVAREEGNPLPRGLTHGFEVDGKHLVKWILLSAAIWPEILGESRDGQRMNSHHGGWLPNWICESSRKVLLRRRGDRRRQGRTTNAREGQAIDAELVAAIVPKPLPVTGWGLGHVRDKAGAKSTHLAVPAGAVYYFEARDAENAGALAKALNWHGDALENSQIINRRSTLMGEKGFGLGVCGTWTLYELSNKH